MKVGHTHTPNGTEYYSSADSTDFPDVNGLANLSHVVPPKPHCRGEGNHGSNSIGILASSCRLPGGVRDEAELWDLLKTGRTAASRIPGNRIATRDVLINGDKYGTPVEGGNFISQDVSGFDYAFFNISRSEAETMDPQQRLLLECVQECIENAGISDMSDVGVFVGLMETEYSDLMPAVGSISSMLGSMCSVISGRINYVFGSHGPSVTVDTACSSSLVAVELAVNALKNGQCSSAIIAGVNLILSEKGQGLRANGKMLSYHGMSLSFDARASGYGRSEGCAVLMLERMRPGIEYMASITDIKCNHGGRSSSLTTPNPFAHKLLINSLLQNESCNDLQYWEAHGTGTRVGDPIEVSSLSSVCQGLMFGSIKASIGHGEASAGASALLKLALMLKHQYIPPAVHFHVMNSRIHVGSLTLPVIGEDQGLNKCGITSFGVSGTNAAAVVARTQTPTSENGVLRKYYLIPVSAKSKESLEEMWKETLHFIANSSDSIEDIAGVMAFQKPQLHYRCALVVDRQGRELQKTFGSRSKGGQTVVIVLADANVSYELLHIPLFYNYFISLHQVWMSERDKLLLCFVMFVTKLFTGVEVHARTCREVVISLMALSFLPKSLPKSSISDLLKITSTSDLLKALATYDINPSNNAIVKRHASVILSHTSDSSLFEIRYDSFFTVSYYNIILISSQLYANGFDINFHRLYRRPQNQVRTPSYFFNRTALWFTEKHQEFDHYLLGMIKEEEDDSATYSNLLDSLRHPHLFAGHPADIGAAIEIVHNALIQRKCRVLCINHIKVSARYLSSPCLLVTKLKRVEDACYVVDATLDRRDFFRCTVSAIDDKKEINKTAKAIRSIATEETGGRKMHPVFTPALKRSNVYIADDLSYAFIDAELDFSSYSPAVQVLLRINPGMYIESIHVFSTLPSTIEIFKIKEGHKTICVVGWGGKQCMHVSMATKPRRHRSRQHMRPGETLPSKTEAAKVFRSQRHPSSLSPPSLQGRNYLGNDDRLARGVTLRLPSEEPRNSQPENVTGQNAVLDGYLVEQRYSYNEETRRHRVDGDLITESLIHAIQDVLTQPLEINDATLNTGLQELGLDSLNLIDFVNRLNEKYFPNSDLSTVDIFDNSTIAQLALYIRKKEGSKYLALGNKERMGNVTEPDKPGIDDKVARLLINAISDVLAEPLEINGLTLTTGFQELGLDSLSLTDFVSRLNEKYFVDLDLSIMDIFDNPTITNLAQYITKLRRTNRSAPNNKERVRNVPVEHGVKVEVEESLINAIRDVLAEPLEINGVIPTVGFHELGLDSLNLIDFVNRLNEKYFANLNLSAADVFDNPTITQLAEHIKKKQMMSYGIPKSGTDKQHTRGSSYEESKLTTDAAEDATEGGFSNPFEMDGVTFRKGSHELRRDPLNSVSFSHCTSDKHFEDLNLSTAHVSEIPTNFQFPGHITNVGTTENSAPDSNNRRRTRMNGSKHGVRDDVLEKIINAARDVLAEPFEVNGITLNTGLQALGLDSLNVIDFVDRLNEKYFADLHLSTTDVFDNPTITQLADYIKRMNTTNRFGSHKAEDRTRCLEVFNHGSKGTILRKVINATRDVLVEPFEVNDTTLSKEFQELGMGSLNLIDFVNRLNEKYFADLHVSTTDIFENPTIMQLVNYIEKIQTTNNFAVKKQMKTRSKERFEQGEEGYHLEDTARDISLQTFEAKEDALSKAFQEAGMNTQNSFDSINHLGNEHMAETKSPTIFCNSTTMTLDEHHKTVYTTNHSALNNRARSKRHKQIKPFQQEAKDDILEKVINAIRDVLADPFEVNDAALNTGFQELGLDSLNLTDFVSRLNDKYFADLHISTPDIFDNPTITLLANHIEKLQRSHRSEAKNGRTRTRLGEESAQTVNGGVLEAVTSTSQNRPNATFEVNQDALKTRRNTQYPTDSISCLGKDHVAEIKSSMTFDKPTSIASTERFNTRNTMNHSALNDHGRPRRHGRTQQFQCGAKDEVLEKVIIAARDVLADPFEINNVTLNMGFQELGLDSLNVIDFVSRLNKKYFADLHISTTDIFDNPTITMLAKYIGTKIAIRPCSDVEGEDGSLPDLSLYVQVFEKNDAQADILLTCGDDGDLVLVNLNNGMKLLKLHLNLQDDAWHRLVELLSSGAVIKFHSDSTVRAGSLFASLHFFSLQLFQINVKVRISVSNSQTLANALARSFFKTAAAEKYPRLQYIYTERLVELTLPNSLYSSKVGGSWLITGGLSGIGLAIAKWLLSECSIDNLVLLSRRIPEKDLLLQLEQIGRPGRVKIISASVADFRSLRGEFARIPFKFTGVIHSAGVIHDCSIERQTLELFSKVFTPKGEGYHVIDRLLDDYDHHVDHFIVMSSFTAVCGNAGQLNYGVSNAYIDYQMYQRRQQGKPGTTIHWGNWLDTGMAVRVRDTLSKSGFLGLATENALKCLKFAIVHKPHEMTAARVDWTTVLGKRSDIRQDIVMKRMNDEEEFWTQCVKGPAFQKASVNRRIGDDSSLDAEAAYISSKLAENFRQSNECPQLDDSIGGKNTEPYESIKRLGPTISHQAANGPTSSSEQTGKSICNIFGLNIFFDNKDDFRQSAKKIIDNPDSPCSFTSSPSTSYALQVTGSSLEDVEDSLKQLRYKETERKPKGKGAMLFAGQGVQYPLMSKQLCAMFPTFKKEFTRCLGLADDLIKEIPLKEVIDNVDNALLLQSTKYVQPIMFAYGYACARLWHSFGFQPNYYLGHSVGELVAGVLAGIMTLEEGIRLVVVRGRALERVAGRGALLATTSRVKEDVLSRFQVSVAGENSSKQVVFAGRQSELLRALEFIQSRNSNGKFVSTTYPFHSSLITEEDLKEFRKVLESIRFKEAQVPVISNVTGSVVTTFSVEYLVSQTISPVRLVDCVRKLESLGVTLWLEAGPTNTLTSFVRSTLDPQELSQHDLLQTTSHQGEDARHLIAAALALERRGIPIDWYSIYQCDRMDTPPSQTVLSFPIELGRTVPEEDREVLKDHYVNKENLAPAAYQVYQLLTWLNSSSSPTDYFTLINTKFVRPWKHDDHSCEFKLTRTNANVLEVLVDGKAMCRSRASFNSKPATAWLNVARIQRECTINCDVKEFYNRLATNGLDYRDHFQVIKSLRRSDTCTYAELNNRGTVWTLLDAALHAVCMSVLHRRPHVYFMPIAFGEVYLDNSLDLQSAKSIVVVTRKTSDNEKFVHADACVLADGKVFFQYKGKLSVILKSPSLPKTVTALHSDEAARTGNPTKADLRTENSVREETDNGSVYITGYDGSFCFDALDTMELWQKMKTGNISQGYKTRTCPLENHALMDIDIAEWDPEFFGVSPKEAVYVDVLQRLMMTSVVRCIENAGCRSLPKETGVFIGVSGSDFNNRVYEEVNDNISGYYGPGTNTSCIAGRIAHWLQTEGPAVVVDTACSSSFTALAFALDAVGQGRCENAIVGGINVILHDSVSQVLKNLGVLSSTGVCRVFDADADGYIRSEAVGCLLLSKRSHPGVEFRISHWAIGHNGQASSLHVPNGTSQERLIKAVSQEKCNQVECHGTGTALGDPVEIRAVSRCHDRVTVSSIKSLLGHAEAASGVVSLISCLLQMRHGCRSPQVHFKCPNPKADFGSLTINVVGEEFQPERMLINNFAFSGANCSIVVEKLPQKQTTTENHFRKYYIAPISAKDRTALTAMIHQFKVYVTESSQAISDICTRLQKGSPSYRYRHCILYDNRRRIVWETDEPIRILGNTAPDKVPHLLEYAYGSGSKQMLAELKEDSLFNSITPLRYHQLVAKKYVEGHPINWNLYNPAQMKADTIVPGYVFKNKRYWPFKTDFACKFSASMKPHKAIYYHKVQEPAAPSLRDHSIAVMNVGHPLKLRNVRHFTTSSFKLMNPYSAPRIILYHSESSSTEAALELIALWQTLETQRAFMLLIAFRSNGTSCSEWTALCRTLASEYLLPYKFVSFSEIQELESELTFDDVFESIFYVNSCRYVERLVPLNLKRIPFSPPKHLLITGGSGGIGRKIIEFVKPRKTTIVTRSANNGRATPSGRNQTIIESDLTTLTLPPNEKYDVVVHCAGVVDNGVMASMDHSKFDKVCKPKSLGLKTLLEAIEPEKVKKVVIASSVASIIGSKGQANYAFANGLMSSLAESSRHPYLLIHWGPWNDVGMLSGPHAKKICEQLQNHGWNTLDPGDALEVLNSDATNVVLFDGDFQRIARLQEHLRKFLNKLVPPEMSALGTDWFSKDMSPDRTVEIEARTVECLKSQRSNAEELIPYGCSLEEIIRSVSGIDDIDEERHTPLMNLGIDSLMIEEIRLKINEKFGSTFRAKDIYDNCTLDRLSRLVSRHIPPMAQQPGKASDDETFRNRSEDIAIIAYSGAFSGSSTVEEFWDQILAGKECITRAESVEEGYVDAAGIIPDIEKFDHKFWKLTEKDASLLDPQIRVFLQHAYHALERSGYIRERSQQKVGVFAGAEPSEYGDPGDEAEGSLLRLFRMNMKDFVATFTAHMLDLRGPAVGVYTACSTALVAIAHACNALLLSKMDLAIAGGVSIVLPRSTRYEFEEGLVLSKTGRCRPFDRHADGTVRGSGVGCVVLKRLDRAVQDNDNIQAVIRGYGVSNDGLHKASFMAPNSTGQEECIRESLSSLRSADIGRIRYVECHGTGTLVGDEIEVDSMKSVYGERTDLVIGSVKANIGHGFAAAGMAGLFKVMKILQEQVIPPQINVSHLQEGNPFHVNEKALPLPPDSLVAVSSFGIGGTNVHLLLEKPPLKAVCASPVSRSSSEAYILPISGASKEACIAHCRAIAKYLTDRIDVDLGAVAATLQTRREHFKYRTAVVVRSTSEAIEQLESAHAPTSSSTLDNSNICFLFAPQGAQYPNMEKASMACSRVFKSEIQRLTGAASELFGVDFIKVLYPEQNPDSDQISNPKFAQVALFIVCKALLAQLDDWGISSNTLLGHSVGEYAAACYAGVLDEHSCMRLLKERGELVSRTREARMLLTSGYHDRLPDDIEISAHLSDSMKCVIGPPISIETLKESLNKKQVTYRELSTKHGFHSSMMDDIKEPFINLLKKMQFHRATKNIVSTMSGEIITEFDWRYCWNHMRNPVDMKKALDTTLSNRQVKVILEVGPSGIVRQLLAERASDVKVVSTILSRRKGSTQPSHSQLLQSVADLWTLGYEVNFMKIFPNSNAFDENVPVYQFDPITCWRAKVPRGSPSYFKASWTPVAHLRDTDHVPLRNERVLLVSNIEQVIAHDSTSCEVYWTRPSEIFAYSADELSRFSFIVYVPDDLCSPLEPFFLSRTVCSAISAFSTRLVVISPSGAATHWTAVGPIKQYHLGSKRKNTFIDNSAKIPITVLINQLGRLKEEILLATHDCLLSINFSDASSSREDDGEIRIGRNVVVIGGNGTIGSSYVEVLRKIPSVENIIVAGRTPKGAKPGVSYIKMDITDTASVTAALHDVRRRYGDIHCIIHTAGLSTSTSLKKTTEEMLSVLRPKVVGVANVLDYLSRNKLVLENLVMASSMTSTLTIQGTEDYCSSNLYMDALALKGHPSINRILSVQWPAWKGVGMASAYGNKALKSIIERNSITPATGRRIIGETLDMNGVVTYSSTSPLQMNKLLEHLQLNGSVQRAHTVSEGMSTLNKVLSVWSDVLGTGITESSDFFDSGGNSLSALRVVWTLSKLLDTNISVDFLFRYSVLKDFVKTLPVSVGNGSPPDSFRATTSLAELTYAQENMYLLRQLEPDSKYNIIFTVFFKKTKEEFSAEKLIHSIHSLIARQHSLRTTFTRCPQTSTPRQVVLSLTESHQNLTLKPLEYSTLLEEEEGFQFRLEEIPLRVRSGQVNSDYLIVFNQHHILTDGWSVTILAKELNAIYTSYSTPGAPTITPLPYSISEYAHKQRQTLEISTELKELKVRLQKREATVLPRKLSSSSRPVFKKAFRILPKATFSRANQLARQNHTTSFVVMLSAFVVTLRKFKMKSDEDSIVIGYPVSGRDGDVKDLIGYFLNNIVLSVDVGLGNNLETIISIVKAATSDNRRFEHVPFHRLVAAMNTKRQLNEHPLFQIYFNYRHQLDFPATDFPEAELEIDQISMNKVFDFSITFDELPEGMRVMVEYNVSRYRTDLIQEIICSMVQNLSIDGARRQFCPAVPLLDYPKAAIAQRLCSLRWRKDLTAVRRRDSSVNYYDFWRRIIDNAEWINRCWTKTSGSSIRSDDVISTSISSNDVIPVILAILKLGAAYAPFDSTWPELRKAQIIDNVGSSLCLSEPPILNPLTSKRSRRAISLNRTTGSDLAYVIHTSGSTGAPKGVAVSHKNVSVLLRGATPQTLLRPRLRVSHSVNVVFDVSVMNIFGSLVNDSELCLHSDIRALPAGLNELSCEFAFLTSAMFNALTDSDLQSISRLDKLFVGGETVRDRNLTKALGLGLDVTQIYGPTECTVWSLTNRCKALPDEGALIGLPAANESCWMADDVKEGELVLAGAKVARGYLNNVGGDKFGTENGRSFYRTGDIVRREKEGFIYRGRNDLQVKIRGHRIDAGEIEELILKHSPQVEEVKVIVEKEILIAFVAHNGSFSEVGLLQKLKMILPLHMVPSQFVQVSRIPLNASGKVDREALLEEYTRSTDRILSLMPSLMSLTEIKLVSIFEALLHVKGVTSTDNFFALGGHSLLLFELKDKVAEAFNVELDVHELLHNLTVEQLALLVSRQQKAALQHTTATAITKLREAQEPKFNVYLIHAVGGTIFPYYSFLQVFPKDVSVYAIEYRQDFEANSIKELAAFYAKQVAAHTRDVRPFLLGHSLGGTISREMVAEMKLWGWEIPFVVMFDTWTVCREQIDVQRVTTYAQKVFASLPDCETRVQNTVRLATMLRDYTAAVSSTKIYLFKSREVGDEAFRRVVRPDLTESISRSLTANMLDSVSTQPIDVWLINGNHDSCMKMENLCTHKDTILALFRKWL